ncbi:MAG: hypothetical protein ABI910_17540 [Gemmatimonadota bacterium]
MKGPNHGSGDDAAMLARDRRAFAARNVWQPALWWNSAELERRRIAGRPPRRAAQDVLGRLMATHGQVTNSPQQSFQREGLERDVALQQLRTGLVQQYGDARLREVRDTIVVSVNRRLRPCCAPIRVDAS